MPLVGLECQVAPGITGDWLALQRLVVKALFYVRPGDVVPDDILAKHACINDLANEDVALAGHSNVV